MTKIIPGQMAGTVTMVGLMSGLSSSVGFCANPFSKWNRALKERLDKRYRGYKTNIKIYAMSSDGTSEHKFFDAAKRLRKQGKLRLLLGAGHSNGCRDWLLGAKHRIGTAEVAYLGMIDMALLDEAFGAVVGHNIHAVDEFHGPLETLDFMKGWDGIKTYTKTKRGHGASANLQWVQDRIFDQITERIDATYGISRT